MNIRSLLPASIGLAAVGTGASISDIRPIVNPAVKPAGLEAQDSHAAASLLGQFRTSLSSWMFLRADLYLHGGVEMRPLTEAELKAGRKGVGNSESKDKPQLHNDDIVVTVVPAKHQDFRGWSGDIEREVSSYRDMKGHKHNNPKSTLPLFRLMTWLDPQFVPGWTTGATILRWEQTAEGEKKALSFLQQGLSNNPNSIDILTQIGFIYMRRDPVNQQRRVLTAFPYLEKAKKIGFDNWRTLSSEEKEALRETYRWICLAYREMGRRTDMINTAGEGLRLLPDDLVLAKYYARPPEVLTDSGALDWLKEAVKKARASAK